MYKRKLCLGLGSEFGVPYTDQIKLIKEAGFDAVFTPWSKDAPLTEWVKEAKSCGLEVQSVHAPFNKTDDLWDCDEEKIKIAYDELIACIHACEQNEIPIMVSHAFIGFDSDLKPNPAGLERYHGIIKEAEKCGVKIAFENTEGEEFLREILDNFGGGKTCGFCLDTGHEMCYNYSKNLLEDYGKYLFSTHINDNLGISDYNGRIYWTDDLHLLPFDGIRDWQELAHRLAKCGYTDTLTFELSKTSKPNRHENDFYSRMSTVDYLSQAYIRACRVATLCEKALTEK